MENGMVRCLLVARKDASTIVFFFESPHIFGPHLDARDWPVAGRRPNFPRPQTRVEPHSTIAHHSYGMVVVPLI